MTEETLDPRALLVLRAALVLPARSDPPANRETEERPDPKDLLELRGLLELGECLAHKARAEIRERLAIRVREDRKDTEDSPVFRVCLGLLANLVTKELLDLLDPVEQEDPQALLVQLEKMVQMVCLDPSDPLDLVVVLERLGHPAPQGILVPPVFLAPRAPASTCLLSLVCLILRRVRTPCGT